MKFPELYDELDQKQPKTKPTIEELEAILNSAQEIPYEILPNGELVAHSPIATLVARCRELEDEVHALRVDVRPYLAAHAIKVLNAEVPDRVGQPDDQPTVKLNDVNITTTEATEAMSKLKDVALA